MVVRKPTIPLSLVPNHLRVATEEYEFRQIWALRAGEYMPLYPAVTYFQDDIYDGNACVLYGQDQHGTVTSTGRIVFDGPLGLPADEIIQPEIDKLRSQGLRVAESSKFAISPAARGILPLYFYTYYEIAVRYEIDSLIFIIRDKNVKLYQKTTQAKILLDDIGYHYGTQFRFSLLECRVQEVIPTFLQHWGELTL